MRNGHYTYTLENLLSYEIHKSVLLDRTYFPKILSCFSTTFLCLVPRRQKVKLRLLNVKGHYTSTLENLLSQEVHKSVLLDRTYYPKILSCLTKRFCVSYLDDKKFRCDFLSTLENLFSYEIHKSVLLDRTYYLKILSCFSTTFLCLIPRRQKVQVRLLKYSRKPFFVRNTQKRFIKPGLLSKNSQLFQYNVFVSRSSTTKSLGATF